MFIERDIWTAESNDVEKYVVAHSVEEAVAGLWFALRKKKKTCSRLHAPRDQAPGRIGSADRHQDDGAAAALTRLRRRDESSDFDFPQVPRLNLPLWMAAVRHERGAD
jgi:hypothetical protein